MNYEIVASTLKKWQLLIFLQGLPDLRRRDRQGTWPRPQQSVDIVGRSKISACCMCDYGTTKLKFTHPLLTLLNIYRRIKILQIISFEVKASIYFLSTNVQSFKTAHMLVQYEAYLSILSDNLDSLKWIIMPTTSFNQSRRSIDVTWQHTLSPRTT